MSLFTCLLSNRLTKKCPFVIHTITKASEIDENRREFGGKGDRKPQNLTETCRVTRGSVRSSFFPKWHSHKCWKTHMDLYVRIDKTSSHRKIASYGKNQRGKQDNFPGFPSQHPFYWQNLGPNPKGGWALRRKSPFPHPPAPSTAPTHTHTRRRTRYSPHVHVFNGHLRQQLLGKFLIILHFWEPTTPSTHKDEDST